MAASCDLAWRGHPDNELRLLRKSICLVLASQRLATIVAGGRARRGRTPPEQCINIAYPEGVSPSVLPLTGIDRREDRCPVVSSRRGGTQPPARAIQSIVHTHTSR